MTVRRWLGPVAAVAAGLAALVFGAFHVIGVPSGPVDAGDWEAASAGDCELMARSLRALEMGGPDSPPLIGRSRQAGPCDWHRWGLAPGRLTQAEFEASTAGDGHMTGYIGHVSLGRPRYSVLRLRASVSVGQACGWECGQGHDCRFERGLAGWRLTSCRPTWIA